MVFVGETETSTDELSHSAYLTLITGPGGMGDPYECTAVVAVEAAECLLDTLDRGAGNDLRVGFGTPAYHLAHLGFVDRLVVRGNYFKMEDGAPASDVFSQIMLSMLPLAD